jgi:hypothetical protein
MEPLRSRLMRGPYHHLLRAALKAAVDQKLCTQESLASDLKKDQTTIGKYLRDLPVSGSLDLDEADIALKHLKSDLKTFINDPQHVVLATDVPTKFARLLNDGDFRALVEVLSVAPTSRRVVAVSRVLPIVQELVRPRGAGPSRGRATAGRRTRKSTAQRRSAPGES